ncbi:Predicted arabinose efflux permease, MFS family [Actinokineospora alba]|uniref:Predicted arabinose efflux permease, MFS family n=1 Tax=Actinokineospora alba TaxID=504798 RepID=A0A1H0SAV8_9PSEU|nr:putative MFS family arabinose efflux permease [Actinokineospora alba]SDI52172.1 Predicted arabinose efflux permease, MFS family [Actinokineospora alba]SDP38807.1 Predicted arabinose efflux permease, MFS family [Actinokineospora alba]
MQTHAGDTREQQSERTSQLPAPRLRPDPAPPALSGTFSSLRIRNYRLFAAGNLASNLGTWMQRIAQDWLVLVLSGHNPVALGIAAALQFAPTILLSLWAGVLADRLDKRKLLIGVQIGVAACALVLGVLDVTGLVEVWHVYILCFVVGVFFAIEVPVRQSFVAEIVGRSQVTNAIALNSTGFNLARVVGPAIAGLMIVLIGTGWLFLANAVLTLAVVGSLFRMRTAELHRTPKIPRQPGQLMAGLRYVRKRPDIMTVMVLVFFVSTFGMTFFVTLAVVAANVFGKDAAGYGVLSTALAVGTLAGALLAARRSSNGRPRTRLLLGAAFAFGVLEVVVGLMPTYTAFAIALFPVGLALMTFMTTANATVQLAVAPEMRGRVMGLYMLVFLGGNPVGAPMVGWMAHQWGARSPLYIGGSIAALTAVACGVFLVRRGGVKLPAPRWRRQRVLRRK